MTQMNDSDQDATDTTENIAGEKREPAPQKAKKIKKAAVTTAWVLAGAACVYSIFSPDNVPTKETAAQAQGAAEVSEPGPALVEASETGAEGPAGSDETEGTGRPVLNFFGQSVEQVDDTTTAEPSTQTSTPTPTAKVKPVIDEQHGQEQLPEPASHAAAPAEKAIEETAAVTARSDKTEAHLTEEQQARSEASTAAFSAPPVPHEGSDGGVSNSAARENGAVAHTESFYPKVDSKPAESTTVYSSHLTAAAVGTVVKVKQSNDGLQFVKVAQGLPTKIRLLPDSEAKPQALLTNEREWVVKLFAADNLIVELKPNASPNAATDLVVKQGEKYYTLTLVATRNPVERVNTVIYGK